MNDIALAEQGDAAACSQCRRERGGALAGSTALIVLGMHRSGTSALTGMLHHLGVALGERLMAASARQPARLLGAQRNRRGARAADGGARLGAGTTSARCRRVRAPANAAPASSPRTRRDPAPATSPAPPLWGLKDPRLCRLMPLWWRCLPRSGSTPRYLLALRHPLDVAASLAVRDGISAAWRPAAWLRHVLDAERRHARCDASDRPLRGARSARQAGAASPPGSPASCGSPGRDRGRQAEAAVDAFLAPELRRRRLSDSAGAANGKLAGWVAAVYDAFRAGESRLDEVCDAVRGEFAAPANCFCRSSASGPAWPKSASVQAQTGRASTGQQLGRVQHEAAELRDLCDRARLREIGGAEADHRAPTVDECGSAAAAGRSRRRIRTGSRHAARPRPRASIGSPSGSSTWPFVPVLGARDDRARRQRGRGRADLALAVCAERRRLGTARSSPRARCRRPLPQSPRHCWHRAAGGRPTRSNRVLAESDADWVALIDAGDQLAPHALFAVADALVPPPRMAALYSDEDADRPARARVGAAFQARLQPRSDAQPALCRRRCWRCGGRRLPQIGGFDPRWDGTEEYDLALRLAERLGAAGFGHVADMLYHRLTISGRTRRPVEAICADMPKIVQAHLDRLGIAGDGRAGRAGRIPAACAIATTARTRWSRSSSRPRTSSRC